MRLNAAWLISILLCCEVFAKTITVTRPKGGNFAIPSTQGFLTSRDLLGKHVFMFFGFSTCPDVCPLTLRTMKQAALTLTPQERENFRFLFVSVDPEVDTIDRLNALKSRYGDQYIGATHSESELAKLTSQFGAFFRIFRTKSGKKIISHTDSIFHINREGKWIRTIPYGTRAPDLVKQLREIEDKIKVPESYLYQASLITENKSCDLATDECQIKVDQDQFSLVLNPKPIRTEQEFSIALKTNSKKFQPTEIDFEGERVNMGYLRPSLKKSRLGVYEAKMTLPICELEKMNWIVRVFLKDKEQKIWAIQYRLSTQN